MAGTMGAIVRNSMGALFGLSNNHVTGGCSNAKVGLPIVAPGILDVKTGGLDPFTVGRHHSVLPMQQGDPSVVDTSENTDAALFSLIDSDRLSSMQGTAYDTPQQTSELREDMTVEKVGRTTGHTLGIVESRIVGGLPVAYKSRTYHDEDDHSDFAGTVFFDPVYLVRAESESFAAPGDSGSLVVTTGPTGDRLAVGLVFAGQGQRDAYILPIEPILERLGVTLVNGLNLG